MKSTYVSSESIPNEISGYLSQNKVSLLNRLTVNCSALYHKGFQINQDDSCDNDDNNDYAIYLHKAARVSFFVIFDV